MKVKELIKLLQKEDPEATVILGKDAEGNGYSPLDCIYNGVYQPETTWSGEFTSEEGAEGEVAILLDPIN